MPDEMKENIKIYEDVILDLGKFMQNLEVANDPMKIYEMFYYMYKNNYLSSGIFYADIPKSMLAVEPEIMTFDTCGCMILGDYGTCRHLVDFLRHIYKGLGYVSSQLFVYNPLVFSEVKIDEGDISREEAQKYIDDAINDLDVFGDEKVSYEKTYGNVKVIVRYEPSTSKINHTVNILKKDKEERIYILDPRAHCIGDIVDEKLIIMHDLGFTYKNYVHHDINFDSYYGTDYEFGLWLLNNFDTRTKVDIMSSIIYREKVQMWNDEYKKFKERNQDRYDTVLNNLNMLVKRLK